MSLTYYSCGSARNDFEKQVIEALRHLRGEGFLLSNVLLPSIQNRELPNEHDIVLLVPWAAYAIDCKNWDAGEYRIKENGPVLVTAYSNRLQQLSEGMWERTPLPNPFHVASQKAKVLRSVFVLKVAPSLSEYPVEGMIVIPDHAHITPSNHKRTFRLRVCRLSDLVREIEADSKAMTQTTDAGTLNSIRKKLGVAAHPIVEGTTLCGIFLRTPVERRQEPGVPVEMQVYEGEEEGTHIRVEVRIYDRPQSSEDGRRFVECVCKRIQAIREAWHPKVMQVVQFQPGPAQVMIAFKRYDGDTLSQLVGRLGRLTPELCRSLIMHLAQTVADLHQVGIIHLDLRPDNILIAPEVGLHLGERHLLTGLTSPFVDNNRIFTVAFHNNFDASFSAPEMWTSGQSGLRGRPQNDVFSLGRIAAYCLLGHSEYLEWINGSDAALSGSTLLRWKEFIVRASDPMLESRYADIRALANGLALV